MAQVSNHGVTISYDVAGEGRPLVLLHGWCCDRSWWTDPTAGAFLDRWFPW
jgi:pimeloyl-ACP methyl ester carboxylesterase